MSAPATPPTAVRRAPAQRVVSLLPSATDVLTALGAGDALVGVTFECDVAPGLAPRVVSSTTLPEGLPPAEIDAHVSAAAAAGEDLYRLHTDALADLDADLVITQDLCAVCAVDAGTVGEALTHLGTDADVLTLDPRTLDDVLDSVTTVGAAVGREEAAAALVLDLRARLDDVARRVAGRPRPRVVVLEWTDPPFGPGHWIPEMVELAGGECVLGWPGERSRPTTFDDVAAARPDLVVVAPCGYDRAQARTLADDLVARGVLPAGVPVEAVDADAHWVRPGPGLVGGVEELSAILHP